MNIFLLLLLSPLPQGASCTPCRRQEPPPSYQNLVTPWPAPPPAQAIAGSSYRGLAKSETDFHRLRLDCPRRSGCRRVPQSSTLVSRSSQDRGVVEDQLMRRNGSMGEGGRREGGDREGGEREGGRRGGGSMRCREGSKRDSSGKSHTSLVRGWS